MRLMKFGGAVLKDTEGFRCLTDIITASGGEAKLVVVSAFSKATSQLRQAALRAESGDSEIASGLVGEIISLYKELASGIISGEGLSELNDRLDTESRRLFQLIEGVSVTRDLTKRTLDSILGYGELFALLTVEQILISKGFSVTAVDSRDVIVTDSNFGSARPIINESLRNALELIMPYMTDGNIVLTQGFTARDLNGDPTTMGIESSNLTATLLASLLGINEVIFWTDVEGIRSADPKFARRTLSLPGLDFKTAYRASYYGLRLVYPGMIRFATDNNIKLIFRSAHKPEGDQTIIGHIEGHRMPFVTMLDEISLLTLPGIDESDDIAQVSGLLKQDAILDVITKPEEIQVLMKNAGKTLKSYPANIRRTDGLSLISVFNISRSFAAELIGQADKILEGEIFMADYSGKGHYLRFLISGEDSGNLIRYINERICNAFSE